MFGAAVGCKRLRSPTACSRGRKCWPNKIGLWEGQDYLAQRATEYCTYKRCTNVTRLSAGCSPLSGCRLRRRASALLLAVFRQGRGFSMYPDGHFYSSKACNRFWNSASSMKGASTPLGTIELLSPLRTTRKQQQESESPWENTPCTQR